MNGFQIGSKRLKVQHKRTSLEDSQGLPMNMNVNTLPIIHGNEVVYGGQKYPNQIDSSYQSMRDRNTGNR